MNAGFPQSLETARYLSLASFRRDGRRVATPLWFAAREGKLYAMTRPESGKVKRIRRNPRVEVAPCTQRGRVTGAWVPAVARIVPPEQAAGAKTWIEQKYWLARWRWLWRKNNTLVEISAA